MNWIERYVEAVKMHLPADRRADIGEELLSIIEDKYAAKEEEKGQALTSDETAEWVESLEKPILVAAGYQEQQYLIGPTLYPYFGLVLKLGFIAVFAASVIISAMKVMVNSEWMDAVPTMFNNLFMSGSMVFTVVTLVFFALEKNGVGAKEFAKWKASSLPLVNADLKWLAIPRFESATSAIFTLIALAVMNGWLVYIPESESAQYAVSYGQLLGGLLPVINVVLIFAIALQLVHLFTPFWTVAKLVANVSVHAGALYCWHKVWSSQASIFLVEGDGDRAQRIAELNGHLNNAIEIAAVIAMAIILYELARDIHRMVLLVKLRR